MAQMVPEPRGSCSGSTWIRCLLNQIPAHSMSIPKALTEIFDQALHECRAAMRRRHKILQTLRLRVPPQWPRSRRFDLLSPRNVIVAGIRVLQVDPGC